MIETTEAILRANLLRLAVAYGEAKGWGLSTVSGAIHGDTPFFDELKRQADGGKVHGRQGSFTARKYHEMLTAFARAWPPGLAWPILRPVFPPALDTLRSIDNVSIKRKPAHKSKKKVVRARKRK